MVILVPETRVIGGALAVPVISKFTSKAAFVAPLRVMRKFPAVPVSVALVAGSDIHCGRIVVDDGVGGS